MVIIDLDKVPIKYVLGDREGRYIYLDQDYIILNRKPLERCSIYVSNEVNKKKVGNWTRESYSKYIYGIVDMEEVLIKGEYQSVTPQRLIFVKKCDLWLCIYTNLSR